MGVLLNISGLVIDFETRFPEYVRTRCKNYLADSADGEDALQISVTQAEIDRSDVAGAGRMEAELYAMTMHLGEILPDHGRIMTHGVAVGCDGSSYIFTAKSGVGKSTHAFLWQKYLGADRVRVINGDKPILWFREDGMVMACGSPWNGKERLDENVCLPLRGICLLDRVENNPGVASPEIKRAERGETFDFLVGQTFLPHSPQALIKTLRLLERLYDNVPVYNLTADMSRESVMVSAGCLLGAEALRGI